MTAVRRSGRARKATESVYDEAEKEVTDRTKRTREEATDEGKETESTDEEKDEAEKQDDGEHETAEESPSEDDNDEEGDDDADDDSSDDDDFEQPRKRAKAKSQAARKKKAATPKKKPSQKKQQPKKAAGKKVQIQVKSGSGNGKAPAKKAPARSRAAGGGRTGGPRRALNSSLTNLAKKVLEHFEVPDAGGDSLVAGLLYSHRPDAAASQRALPPSFASRTTAYTPQLTALARSVISLHNSDPNAAQLRLLNLLFRSVGGTAETNLDPEDIILEEMDNDDWARAVTDLVDEMRHTPADRILLCADPDGAVHASAVLEKGERDAPAPTHASLGVREYRKIYEEFWYVLGGVALSEGGMASNAAQAEVEDDIEDASSDEEEDDDDVTASGRKRKKTPSKKKKKAKKSPKRTTFTTTIRFDAELVKDLINRVVELVSVGQPDVRAAATVAAYQLGRAILDKTALLNSKLDVAKRQHAAATKRNSPGKGSGGGRKAESLKHQIDSLRRTREDLEEVVMGPVVQGVFIHRYRDSNLHIRQASIQALSSMMLQRPDLFLMDKYLKYLGWMTSDKAECVRCEALSGLVAPFDAVHGVSGGVGQANAAAADGIDLKLLENVSSKFLPRLADCVVDVSPRVQECAIRLLLALLRDGFLDEVEDESVWNQINLRALARDATPVARRDALYFVMEQLEAFDDADDDEEDDDGEQDGAKTPKKRKSSGGRAATQAAATSESSERRTVQRLDALASWTAHALTDGPIPIDKIRIDLADLIVLALRDMPEHKHLVTDWSALTKAIGDDRAATTMQGTTAGDRGDVAKQRVLVQMLACAARAEVGAVTDASFLGGDVDPDVVAHQASTAAAGGGSTAHEGGGGRGHRVTKASTAIQHESLSVALLRALPDLLIKFKSDSAVLRSLTILPRYLLATVFSLPQRKSDFARLSKNLAEVYLNSTDEKVLQNTALSLYYLTEGDHARAPDATLQLKETTQELQTRLVDLFSEDGAAAKSKSKGKGKSSDDDDNDDDGSSSEKKRRRSSRGASMSSRNSSSSSGNENDKNNDDDVEKKEAEETEYALYLNLKRLRVLSKRCDCAKFFGGGEDGDAVDTGGTDERDASLEGLSSLIADGLNARLKAWKVERGGGGSQADGEGEGEGEGDNDGGDDDERSAKSTKTSSPWVSGYESVSAIVAGSVTEGLTVLASLTAWKLLAVQREHALVIPDDAAATDDDDGDAMEEEDVDDHLIMRMRDRIVALVINCYDQFLDRGAAEVDFVPEQIAFADAVQESAGRITSDLRCLFPKEWKKASSPLLRAFAMEDDGRLLSGYVRYLKSNEALLKASEAKEADAGKGDAEKNNVAKLLLPISRALAYNWTLGNRREAGVVLAHLTGSGRESHDIVTALSRTFKKVEPVRLLEAQMASLRTGYEAWLDAEPDELESERPTDEEMTAFAESERRHAGQFVQLEALATKFSQSLGVGKLSSDRLPPALLGFMREGIKSSFHTDEEWALGSRLSFLNVLSKYSVWLKKNKAHLLQIEEDLDEKEMDLREHAEFPDVHVDDLACLESFRSGLGLKPLRHSTQSEQESNVVEEETNDSVSDLMMTPATQRSGISRMTPGTQQSMASTFSRTSRASRASSRRSTRSGRSEMDESELMTPGTQHSTMTPGTQHSTTTPGTQHSTTTPGTQRSTTTPGTQRSTMTPGTQRSTMTPGTARSAASRYSRASSRRSSLRSNLSNLSPLYEDNSPSSSGGGGGRDGGDDGDGDADSTPPSEFSEEDASQSPLPKTQATQATVEGEVSDGDHHGSDGFDEEEESRYSNVDLS